MNILYSLLLTLTLTGNIDIRGLLLLRDNNVPTETLDLSGADINEYTYTRPVHAGMSHFQARVIPQYIFFRAPYAQILLPADIRAIDNGAFSGSELTSIEIPEGVTSIGDYAFYGCTRLQSVSLPTTLRHIGKGAFAGCVSLSGLNLSQTEVTDIPERCFAGSKALTFLHLPADILSVGTEAFAGTNINTLMLPSVRQLAPYALADMPALRQVTLNKDAVYNEGTLMNNGKLERVSGTPQDLPSLFAANCYTLSPSDIFDKTVSIGQYAFSNTGADMLVLAATVESIDKGAFTGLFSLHTIYADALLSDTPAVDAEAFEGLNPAEITLHVAQNHEEAWRQHPVWGLFDITSRSTVGTDKVIADDADGISTTVAGDMLTVSATAPLTECCIYSIDGRLLATLPLSGQSTAVYDLSLLSERVLIITAATPASSRTTKILR